MNIGVLLKQVPASDSRIKINADRSGIDAAELKWEINAYDEFALEAAMQIKQAGKATKVIIITLAGPAAEQRIRDGLARGADEAIRLDDAAFNGSDSLGKARILAAAAAKAGCGMVLAGKQAIDDDAAQVPAMVAEILGWAQISVVDKLECDGAKVKAARVMGGGNKDMVEAALPAVVTCDKGLNTPRFASLMGIQAAKKKTITVWGAADLGVDPATVGSAGALVEESDYQLPPARPAGRIIDGATPEAKVKELVRLLRDEAKVL